MYKVVLSVSIFAFIIENGNTQTSSAIPDLLYDCYTSNYMTTIKPPSTVRLLVELLRKIELSPKDTSNLRILATSLLHGVVLDGVREISTSENESIMVPFRAAGTEFYKYKLLVDYFTPGEKLLFPADALTKEELCTLHFLLSNTVDPRSRGDEQQTCIHQSKLPLEFEALVEESEISDCPIKKGNVYTKWGSISAGYLIAAVASALQPMFEHFEIIEAAVNTNTTLSIEPRPREANGRNVSNLWVATIAGGLASAILNQAVSAPNIGATGFWNDSLLPQTYYLKSTTWDMTESDILGSIDGLAMAHFLENQGSNSLRLSQLIDMYYSDRGVMSNEEYKVTNRSAILKKLLNEINLQEQVTSTAKLLQRVGTYNSHLSDANIEELSAIVTETFKKLSENITQTYDTTEGIHVPQMVSRVEIIIIFDGSYDAYTAHQIIHVLSEAADVSQFGSRIGVMNGQTGNWMANVTEELSQLFSELSHRESDWPVSLSLGRSLESIIYYYENTTTADCNREVSEPLGRSILIVSHNGRLTDNDLDLSAKTFNAIKNRNPETNFILATSPEGQMGFTEFTKKFRENDHVVVSSENVHALVKDVAKNLNTIKGNVVNFYCKQNMRDFVTPDVGRIYEIRKEYVLGGITTTKFSTTTGKVTICGTGNTQNLCKSLSSNNEISFGSEELCAQESACNLEFKVLVNDTGAGCIENFCRYPDQVKLDISLERNVSCIPKPIIVLVVLFVALNKVFTN